MSKAPTDGNHADDSIEAVSVDASRAPGSVPDGWQPGRGSPFDRYIGPFYYRSADALDLCSFMTDQRHGNMHGLVHGGMISSAFDLAMGNACWSAIGKRPCVTIQLNVHFVAGLNIGHLVFIRSEVVRTTRSLVFVKALMQVAERTIASADGMWKLVVERGA